MLSILDFRVIISKMTILVLAYVLPKNSIPMLMDTRICIVDGGEKMMI